MQMFLNPVLNPELIKLARARTRRVKQSFQPPAGAMDPAMAAGGGMPPGGAPPMDPSIMAPPAGGAPPADPSGGAVPGAGGLTADSIRQIMMEVMQQSQMQGGAPGAAGGGMGGAGGKANKDQQQQALAQDVFQTKKMLAYLFKTMNIEMPPDILDGPNRDPASGMVLPPGTPGSTSDPNAMQAQPAPAAGGGGEGGAAQQSSIPPIGPIQGAFPGSGGGEKSSAACGEGRKVMSHAAALNAVLRNKRKA